MAKSKPKSGASKSSAIPTAELLASTEQTLTATYSREQIEQSFSVVLDQQGGTDFEALFERAVRLGIGATPEQRVAWVNRYEAAHRGVPDAVPWWDVAAREWLLSWAKATPAELAAHREHLSKPLGKLADFCLALTTASAMPDDVAAAIAKHFLNSPPNGYAYADLVSVERVVAYAERALTVAPFPVLRRERVDELARGANLPLLFGLAVNYCALDFRRVGVALLVGHGAHGLTRKVVEEWATTTRSPEGRIVLSLVYARLPAGAERDKLPEWAEQALLLDLRSGSLDDVDITRESLLALPNDIARHLLGQAIREERATLLIPALADEPLLHEFLARVEAGDVGRDTAVEALGHCGGEGLSALLSFPGCAKSVSKVSANLATVVAESIGRLLSRHGVQSNRATAAAVLVPWLGHSSKAVVAAAKRTLEALGADAHSALVVATTAGKKQLRDEAQRLLEKLTQQQPEVSTPLDDVRTRAAASQAAGEEFLKLCHAAFQQSDSWSATLRPLVSQHGALCLQWLRPWFEEHVPQGDVRLWCYVVDLLSHDTEAVWVAVDTFARMPKLPTSLWARPRRALAKLGDKLPGPAKHVLTHGHTEYAEPIYGMLAAYAGEEAVELLLSALSSDSKAIRSHAVDGLSRLASAPLEPVLSLLASSNPGVRISAAELLAVWGRPAAREPLQAALRGESRAPVRAYLEEALAAVGALPLWDGGGQAGGETLSSAEIDSRLESALCVRGAGGSEPRFLLGNPLPDLVYKSGAPLSEEAKLGFLALVVELDSTLKGRLVRQVSARIDPSSLAGWSRHLYGRWNRSKDTKFKWAIYQVWLLADEELVDEVCASIGRLRANEHVVVACCLRVLQWRGSKRALDWLVHWASSLPSRGARTLAQTLLGRVAYRTGQAVRDLRATTDRWIFQRNYEHELVSKPALERFDAERFVEYLEDCLLTGRTWSWVEWSALHDRFSEVFKRLVWRVLFDQDGKTERFDAAITRRGVFQSGAGGRVEGDCVKAISLAHPLLGSSEEWSKVRQWLGEKGNDPPLLQEERPVFVHGAKADLDISQLSTNSQVLDRWLKRRGWFHGEPLDHGLVYSNTKTLGAKGLTFQLNHSGYPIGQHEFAERIQVHSLEVFDLDGGTVALSELSSEVYSELCYQLSQLRPVE